MNISLNEEQNKNIKNKFLEFQKIWTLEKVKSMSLEEYTNTKKDNPDRNDFTFWIENKLDDIGSIWGGSSFKFGIYKRNFNDDKENLKGKTYNDNYAWLSKYGNNQDEAFENVKKIIVKIIQASKNNDLETIENIDFGDATKWKIAFHYQDVNNIKIVNIFSKNVLDLISLNEFKEKLKIYQIYEKLLENKNLSLIKMIENIAIPLWVEYGINIKKMKKLFCEYLSKRNIDTSTIKKYVSSVENISNEFLKDNLYSCNLYNFDQNIEKLNKNNKFALKNNNGNKMYSIALKHYRAFLYDFERQFLNNEIIYKELNMKNLPLNQILYGPPGTGKTYHTIDKALEILGENLENRIDKKAKFDEYVKNGQIVFTTFHQSYGYEEFVEGIKPITNKDNENSKELEYEIKDGVFKDLCEKALDNYKDSKLNIEELNEKIKLEEKVNNFLNTLLENGKPISKTKGGNFFIRNLNDKTIEIESENVERSGGFFKLSLSTLMELLKYNGEFDNASEMFRKVLNRHYLDRSHTYYFNLLKKFKDFEKKSNNVKEDNNVSDNTLKPYIIIIDEINRGNVSKIFGELITLIEPSKRIGAEEELRVALPYSERKFDDGKGFGVPENVYIIGTMNTADRSITSLDTALRRRFEFVEMMPNPKELENLDYKDVDLSKLLTAINTRIECLLDREKTIGHAFFIGVKNLENLKSVFQNKIIPLLQEYFYDDYASINAVLNNNEMVKEATENKENDYLNSIKKLETYNEKTIYNITPFDNEIWDKIETYQKIYIDNKTEENNKNND